MDPVEGFFAQVVVAWLICCLLSALCCLHSRAVPQVQPTAFTDARLGRRPFKAGLFVVLTLNIYATCYYINYLFFYLRDRFAYTNRDNLWFAAACGLLYTLLSWIAGRF